MIHDKDLFITNGLLPAVRQTIAENIYQQLLEAITTGVLKPGSKLVIDDLARQFQVSNTPVREALKTLKSDGLIEEMPFNGMYVKELLNEELYDLFAVRGVIEGYALRIAADHITEENFLELEQLLSSLDDLSISGNISEFHKLDRRFHETILKHIKSDLFQDLINQLARNSRRYVSLINVMDQQYMMEIQKQHHVLYELLREGKGDEIEAYSRFHSNSFAEHLAKNLSSKKNKPN